MKTFNIPAIQQLKQTILKFSAFLVGNPQITLPISILLLFKPNR
jgi:hypothetical protein